MPAVPFALVPAVYLLLLRRARGTVPRSGRAEVLLQLRRGTGYMDGHWACGAAGHVEAGESVLDAAVREAREEIGVVVDPRALEPLTAMHRSNDVGGAALEQRVDFFFALRRWEGEPVVREPARTGGLAWCPLAGLPEPVPPHERAVLELLRESPAGGRAVPAAVDH